ncbi:EAL domain-containing protein [Neptuniibacter sp.]|uniref:bifunctional diguanylate cyclase/phosphodiesterase n=1 Tax=Neptuniibacter sp. TaxID=1962643 RepID=UPI0026263826|nr:EAL domain-containing protein [Neptuniibacter sp.]MCP4596472.1 EAL domain-containing protein [Neptuniibacter sp.]
MRKATLIQNPLVLNLVVMIAYLVTAKLALGMAEHGYASPFWPPSGISLAALLLGGMGMLPGVFLGAFFVNWQVDSASVTALQIAFGNSLEALTALLLTNKFITRRYFFNDPHNIFKLTLIAVVSCALAAVIGSHAVTDWSSSGAMDQFKRIWLVWWLGDLVGILIFTPLIMVFAREYKSPDSSLLEVFGYTIASIILALIVFGGWTVVEMTHAPLAFLPIPLLIAVGYRFGYRGSTLLVLFIALSAINGTLAGYGPFVSEDIPQSLLIQQVYMCCISLCGLLLCSVILEREKARAAMQRLSAKLEIGINRATEQLREKNETLQLQQEALSSTVQELKTNERRYRALFENAPEAVVLFSLEQDRFIDVNDNALKLYGYSREELLKLSVRDVSPEEQPDGTLSAERAKYHIEKALAGDYESFTWTHINSRRDPVACEVRLVPFPAIDDVVVRGSVTNIEQRLKTEERLLELTTYDALTGLYNRNAFLQFLEQNVKEAERSGFEFSVLVIDLDGFKRINDSMGHDHGDRLLCAVADRLRACCRSSDLIARLGGDEFTLLVKAEKDIDQARLADKLLGALSEAFDIGGHSIFLSGSIGISHYPVDGIESKEILKNADLATYRAKSAGGNSYQFFTLEMKERIERQMQLEMELRHALTLGQLELFYQPQIDLSTNSLIGLECLLRWNHPQEGVLYPGTFIDVAEQSGLICQIGEWVVHQSCQQAAQWQQEIKQTLPVSINISARQFQDHVVLEKQIKEALDCTGIKPSMLELELTESMLMDNVNNAITVLSNLRKLGVRAAIDDFGTGYSSLSYLKQFSTDKLKIDRSFINEIEQDLDDAAIVKATIAMAHGLGLKVIAEGVENEGQKTYLQQLGCDEIQGYLVSPALPADELIEFLYREGYLAE